MDQKNKLMDTEEGNKYNLLMRIRTLLLVLSLISLFSLLFIVFYFSDGVSISPYSLTHTLERKYMFLICNGILAFLAKTSSAASRDHRFSALPDDGFLAGSAKYSSSSCSAALADDHDRDDQRRVVLLPRLESSGAVVEKEQVTLGSLQSEEADLRSADEGESDVVLEGNKVSETAPEEEEEEAISTEELNKRIEEFNRKMKEEIRIEAQQQLIAV